MSIYKQASREKLRFQTNKGELTTEQLWSLSMPELEKLAAALKAETEKSEIFSFSSKQSDKDTIAKLKYDVVFDIGTTRNDELVAAAKKNESRKHNEKIYDLINRKKEDKMANMSEEELEKLLIEIA
jgi:hypothetical protein